LVYLLLPFLEYGEIINKVVLNSWKEKTMLKRKLGNKGEVNSDEEAMRNMSHLGQTIAWLGTAIASIPET